MEGLNIEKGMAVEVNLNGEISQNVWSPAIVLEEVGLNSFLVKCCRSKNDDDEDVHTTETVESFYIRPSPPKFEVESYGVLEIVDAFHGSSWKKGTIKATLTQGRYNIFLDSENEEIQFGHPEIRPHLDWKNGNWVGFREIPKATAFEVVDSVKTLDATDDTYETSSVKKSRKNPLDIEEESNVFGVGVGPESGEQKNVSEVAASCETELKGLHIKIAELASERAKIDEKINAIEKTISELEERLALKSSERAAIVHQRDILQIDANNLSAAISKVEEDFQRQVNAPW